MAYPHFRRYSGNILLRGFECSVVLFALNFLSPASVAQTLTSSDLPICIIDTKGQAIPDDPKITADMKIIYNGPGTRNYISDQGFHYHNAIGIEKRGNSSQNFPQLQYGIETRDSVTGANLNVPLLGMPAENDWVLNAPYYDISMIRNVISYHLWDKMGHWGPRTRLCEVILNGEYQGVYVLTEKIKEDKDRVDIADLYPEDIAGTEVTGGYILKIDAKNNPEDVSFDSKVPGVKTSAGENTVTWILHYPKSSDLKAEQYLYIQSYIDTVEAVIQSEDFDDPETGYARYISKQSFIDYFIHTELTRNADGYKRSAYFYKEKQEADGSKGKLKAGPVWDYNFAYGNVNFCGGDQVEGWVYEGCETLPVPALWGRLMQDPAFVNEVKCRYRELRNTILSRQYLAELIDRYALDSLQEAQSRHFQKYADLLLPDEQPQAGFNWVAIFCPYRVDSYSAEIDSLKSWFGKRLAWLDNNLAGSCPLITAAEDHLSEDSKLYPNPASGRIVLEASSQVKHVELYDAFGKKLPVAFTEIDRNTVTSDGLQGLQEGLYYLKFEVNGQRQYKKLLKSP